MLSYETDSLIAGSSAEGLVRGVERWFECDSRVDLRMLPNVAKLIEERKEKGADSNCEGNGVPWAELPLDPTFPNSSILSII